MSALAANEEELDKKVAFYAEVNTASKLKEFRTSAPLATREVKQLVQYVDTHSDADNQQHVKEVFARTFAGYWFGLTAREEARYGVGCFMKKEKPNWPEFHRSKSKL